MSWTTTGRQPTLAHPAVQIDEGVLNVLSASTYTEQSSLKRYASKRPQIPMGIVVEDSTGEEEESGRPRKRVKASKKTSSKANEGSDDANKKHRGRPRIEGQDETAVDRRRTQIRLAQRAYRNRKETTISTLKIQNSELQQSIARMADLFKIFQEDIDRSQVLRHQTRALQHLSVLQREFEHAASLSATEDQADNDSSTVTAKKQSEDVDKQNPTTTTTQIKSTTPSGTVSDRDTYGFLSDEHSMQRLPSKTNDITFMDMTGAGLESIVPQSSYFDWNPEIMMPGTVNEIDQTGNLMGNWPADALGLERSFPQRRSYTYSFQETTFARRLHRLCLERAFRALTNPDTDPGFLARTFRFTLFYLNKRKLRDGLQRILQKKAGESLENWEVPFFHVGGAGTQFPRRDAVGKPIFPPNLQSPAMAPGPWQLVVNDNESVDEGTVQAMLDEMGYGGQWFDSHDVEEYLKSKGVFLDGSSSFMDLDTMKIALPSDATHQSTTSSAVPTLAASPASSQSFPSTSLSGATGVDGVKNVASALNDQLALLGAPDRDFLSTFHWSTATPDQTSGAPTSPGVIPSFEQVLDRKQGVVTFDVERFLERVVEGGSCLGRAPGFRKDVVDSALALAVQEAF